MLSYLRSLKNSPTSARDLSQILSPIRLGLWFTIFNIAVAGAFAFLYAVIDDISGFSYRQGMESQIFGSVELGQMFASVLFITIAIFLTFFVPIRILGFIIGPRTLRYLDQIVISGISPARYMAGKVILQNLFLLVVLAAAVPYLVLCFALGGVSIPFVLCSIFALWLYTNLLCLVSLLASVLAFEFIAIPSIILFFGMVIWAGFLPFPPHLLNLSPIPVFTSPSYQVLFQEGGALNSELSGIYSATTLFGGLLGTHVFNYAITVSIAAAFLFLFLSIGPLISNSGSGPLSDFGTVIMPGDSKKKRIFRGHVILRRRGELAFFYENRPDQLRSLDLLLRWGAKETMFLALVFSSVLYLHILSPVLIPIDFFAVTLFVGIVLPVINVFFFTRDRTTSNLHYPKRSAAEADNFFFFLNATLILFFVFIFPFVKESWFTPVTFRNYRQFSTGNEHLLGSFVLIGSVVAVGSITLFALVQWLSTRIWSHLRAFVSGVFLYSLALTIPFIIYSALAPPYRERNYDIAFFDHIASLSPVLPVVHLLEDGTISPFDPSILPTIGVHLIFAALFFFLAYRRRDKLPQSSPA